LWKFAKIPNEKFFRKRGDSDPAHFKNVLGSAMEGRNLGFSPMGSELKLS
jgi:hypothetical protein